MAPSFWTAPLRRPRAVTRYVVPALRASATRRGGFIPGALRWIRQGGDPRWALHPETWLALRAELDRLPREARFLELGAGLGSLLAAARGLRVTAVDNRTEDLERLKRAAGLLPIETVRAPLEPTEEGDAYAFSRIPTHRYHVVFVDGPAVGREGILSTGGLRLLSGTGVIVFDDADRPDERSVATEVAARLGRPLQLVGPAAVIRTATPEP
jgi:precorrin-6B methylase 2